jgi:hypothetical protein
MEKIKDIILSIALDNSELTKKGKWRQKSFNKGHILMIAPFVIISRIILFELNITDVYYISITLILSTIFPLLLINRFFNKIVTLNTSRVKYIYENFNTFLFYKIIFVVINCLISFALCMLMKYSSNQ